jgi:hypothetical protein
MNESVPPQGAGGTRPTVQPHEKRPAPITSDDGAGENDTLARTARIKPAPIACVDCPRAALPRLSHRRAARRLSDNCAKVGCVGKFRSRSPELVPGGMSCLGVEEFWRHFVEGTPH